MEKIDDYEMSWLCGGGRIYGLVIGEELWKYDLC